MGFDLGQLIVGGVTAATAVGALYLLVQEPFGASDTPMDPSVVAERLAPVGRVNLAAPPAPKPAAAAQPETKPAAAAAPAEPKPAAPAAEPAKPAPTIVLPTAPGQTSTLGDWKPYARMPWTPAGNPTANPAAR